MRSLGERLNLLRKKLINIRCGPGAAILPAEVTRIHMDFALRLKGGHMGARKFWREYLPRLKYHNPSIPMIVNRHDQNQLPPTMTIYLRKADSSAANPASSSEPIAQPSSSRTNLSKAQPPTADERVVHIDMANKHSSHILEFFMAETRAVPLQPTNEEIAEMQALETLRKNAEVDRERVRLLRLEKKKEEDMLKRARAAGGMAEQEEV
ncbi:L51_S25_CI-B8 domain-containing protein [Trichoderma simmonsii]|uniref:L51_S25_CI-B8 domain-containing protein n=1 Tax=Trichoderma simmonsii TaxID=1491479 RepID=A0A8G0LKT7_9HYPO|nr:L51_S25_CI-B8 domain-containing protein [Trichoderma simmonsii]